MYTVPDLGTKVGLSYGQSNLDANKGDKDTALVETNESYIIGLYQPIGHGINLVAEYTHTEAEAHYDTQAEEDTISLGAILFF